MTELPWMAEARRHVGLKEIVGAKHNPIIQSWLKEMGNFPNAAKAWYADDGAAYSSVTASVKAEAALSKIGIAPRHGQRLV